MLTYGQCRNCVFFRMTEIGDPASQPHYPVGKTQLPKKEYRSGLAYGDCHAHAPTVFQTKTIGVIEQRWPRTQSEYGCGDWQRVTETGEQE